MSTKKTTYRGIPVWLSSRSGNSKERSYYVFSQGHKHRFTFINGNKERAETALQCAYNFIDGLKVRVWK